MNSDPILPLAAQIVSAHIEHNPVEARELPELIRDVYRALAGLRPPAAAAPRFVASAPRAAAPAAPTRRNGGGQTVFADHLICMECGLHMKMLKRHLQTVHGMSPPQYRSKHGLAGDYPMVAQQYAALRSSLAKESGLGKRPIPRGR